MSRERGQPDRPLYCGNYEYEMLETEIKRLFEDYGEVDRIDMKTFCFVYMRDDRDADRAMRKLDGRSVGRRGRPLRVQWAKTRDADRAREVRPSTTLFVVNFDTARTRTGDIERHFEPYGRIKRVEIKKGYAFVQYEALEDAEYAMKKTHLSNLDGRTITVEYVQNEDPNAARGRPRGDDYGRDRGRDYDRGRRDDFDDRDRNGGGRRRSPYRSPVRSPVRRDRSRSPVGRSRSRSPIDRSPRSRSPVGRGRSPADRGRSPADRSPAGRDRSPADRARSYSR